MGVNPTGLVIVYDFGSPRIVSGRAREAISGGQLVFASGAAAVVSSGANSFDPKTDLLFAQAASGAQFTGVAMQNAASGAQVSVLLDGVVIASCGGTVTAATTVVTAGDNAIQTGTTAGQVCGRALSSDASGGYALFHIGG